MHFMKAALKKMLPPSHVTEDLEQLGLSKEKAAAVGGLVRQRVGNVRFKLQAMYTCWWILKWSYSWIPPTL